MLQTVHALFTVINIMPHRNTTKALKIIIVCARYVRNLYFFSKPNLQNVRFGGQAYSVLNT